MGCDGNLETRPSSTSFLEKLQADYPGVEFELCSSNKRTGGKVYRVVKPSSTWPPPPPPAMLVEEYHISDLPKDVCRSLTNARKLLELSLSTDTSICYSPYYIAAPPKPVEVKKPPHLIIGAISQELIDKAKSELDLIAGREKIPPAPRST